MTTQRLHVTDLPGYLGAGTTTLFDHILAHCEGLLLAFNRLATAGRFDHPLIESTGIG